jgi:processive 1,2-diacylglycerol beta-glucosyltransferase
LQAAGAEAQVADPCLLGTPRLTAWVNRAYRWVTTHFPWIWEKIYYATDRVDLSQQHSAPLRLTEEALAKLLEQYQPHAVVSTYPLYPYLLTRIEQRTGLSLPVFVVVTDSMEINAAWLRARCTAWLVTDSVTRESMLKKGMADEQVVDTGFPVNPVFSELTPVAATDSCKPFRILYFPTANLSFLRRHARALLDAAPEVQLTIILGRNVRWLYSRAKEIKDAYPGRVKLVGWTRRVPRLLSSHHLIIGKAGGATVHEAIAARCPMLIHHLVPGQEEGNLRLLEIIGGGHLAESPAALAHSLNELLADDAAGWRRMKNNLSHHGRNAGAIVAADHILKALSPN